MTKGVELRTLYRHWPIKRFTTFSTNTGTDYPDVGRTMTPRHQTANVITSHAQTEP